MRVRIILVWALLICGIAPVWADDVTEKQALELAQQFVASHNTRKATPTVKAAGQVNGLYVFNVSGDGGFVIVSNDDQTVPILGYGQSGNIDLDNLPDNMRAWLEGYAEQIAWVKTLSGQSTQSKAPRRTAPKAAVSPLVTSHWNQGAPYNNLCPEIDGVKTVTGCVATTLAQLVYYHYVHNGFAASSTALESYTTSTENKAKEIINLDVSGLAATTFEWADMTATYGNASTDAAKNAVAKLMRYCGTALHMMYGLGANGGSSSYSENIPYALKHCFGYDGGVRHCYRKNYSYTAWVDLIYSELAANRPVALGGQSAGGGHSFICDGYKYESETDYFHINWGWGGRSDGYFLLSLLNPYDQGIGGSSTLDGFSFGQNAIIGIQQPTAGTKDYCLSLEGLRLGGADATLDSKTFTRASSAEAFTGISLYFEVWNYNYGSTAYDATVQLVDGVGKEIHTFGGKSQTLNWNDPINATLSPLSIPAGLDNGTYYIKVQSKPSSETDWQECFDGDAYQLTAVISGNDLTISVPIPANTLPTATLAVSGNFTKGTEQTVTATITGSTGAYNDNIVLRVNNIPVMGTVVNVLAGETVEVPFSFIPQRGGANTLALYDRRTGGHLIGSVTVNITDVFTLANEDDNSSVINGADGNLAIVTLGNRTLFRDAAWNTLCLPFGVCDGDADNDHPAAEGGIDGKSFTGTQLQGATVMELDTRTGIYTHDTGLDDKTLYLNFREVKEIVAGTPYIIKWDADAPIENPVFNSVTIDKTMHDVAFTGGSFKGTYANQTFAADTPGILFLGASNTLYWPQAGATIGACRAYFDLGVASSVRAFHLNFGDEEATGISLTPTKGEENDEGWYDLSGRKLQGKPIKKGVYIQNGKKVVVK